MLNTSWLDKERAEKMVCFTSPCVLADCSKELHHRFLVPHGCSAASNLATQHVEQQMAAHAAAPIMLWSLQFGTESPS